MADAQNLPANLRFFMSRLQGVSTSHYKVFPTAGDEGTANKIIRFELPSNVLINLKSARLMFGASVTAASGGYGRLPEDTRSLIERVTIYAGGVQIQNGHNAFNVLAHAKKALTGMQPASALTHPEFVRSKSYHNAGNFAAADEAYTDIADQLAIDSFDGFFGTAAPSIIDTGIFPQITVEFTLADNNVCSCIAGTTMSGTGATDVDDAGAGTVTYKLEKMTMQIEVLGMASSILDEIVAERISQVGYLSIPFKNYYTFTSIHNGTTRFNVNSSSFDKLWCCWRNKDFGSSKTPVVVAGYKSAGAKVSGSGGVVQTQTGGTVPNQSAAGTVVGITGFTVAAQTTFTVGVEVGIPGYDTGGVMGTNCEKYQTKYFQFKQELATGATNANGVTYQLQINGANYPAYRLNTSEALAMSLNSVDYFVNSNRPMTLDQFKKNYCVQCYRFALPESDAYRLASGLDTRATSAQCAVITDGLSQTDQHLTLFAECTAELRVASRQVELIP